MDTSRAIKKQQVNRGEAACSIIEKRSIMILTPVMPTIWMQPSCQNRMLVTHISATRFEKFPNKWNDPLTNNLANLEPSHFPRFLLCSKTVLVDFFFCAITRQSSFYYLDQLNLWPHRIKSEAPTTDSKEMETQTNRSPFKNARLVTLRRTVPTFIMTAKLLPVVTAITIICI